VSKSPSMGVDLAPVGERHETLVPVHPLP